MESMAAVANTYALVAIDMVGLKGHDEAFRGLATSSFTTP